MDMEYSEQAEINIQYQPTTTQLTRAAELRRFNRLFVYLPVTIAAIIAIAVTGFLFWITLIQQGASSRETVSGIASAVVILVSIPMTILCALPSLLIIGITIQSRQKGQAPLKRIQMMFWKLDSLILRIQSKIYQTLPKFANIVIRLHAAVAYVHSFAQKIISLLKRG